MGDDEPCDIVGKGNMVVSLSNGSTLKSRNVTHVSKLKRNLISISQLMDGGTKITFNVAVCKITKGAMVIAYGKREGTLYMTLGSGASILVALLKVDARVWHRRLRHMRVKGMKVMHSKDKLSGLKYIDLDFYENYTYEKQKRVSFSIARKTPKAEKLELVHTDV